jgi:GMP synthase (glutamine-hydrolysing)
MSQEISERAAEEQQPTEVGGPFPFPFNQHTFCRYEPISQRIGAARVLIVDNLLRDENDLSAVGLAEWGDAAATQLKRERLIAEMALENISNNVARLVKDPTTQVAHLADVARAAETFKPDAIVLSGTLQDFDFYKPEIIESFGRFIRATRIPVLAICGGHQIVGMSFGAHVKTLDKLEQHEQRANRPLEYQYRFVRITDPQDPIFTGLKDCDTGALPSYPRQPRILRVWQNHGLQLDQVPAGFKLLATSYLCRNQMMVKRSDGQLIYTVQFHLEKSFEDWNKSRTRWEHQNESRDGRILFENFLDQALAHSA